MRIITEKEKNSNEFLKMLAWIYLCGSVGHTSKFEVTVDGDGQGIVKFDFLDEESREKINEIKNELLEEYINKGKDLKEIIFE